MGRAFFVLFSLVRWRRFCVLLPVFVEWGGWLCGRSGWLGLVLEAVLKEGLLDGWPGLLEVELESS